MQLIDIQKELPPEGVEVFFINPDGTKDIIEYTGKDNDRDIIEVRGHNVEYGSTAFEGHWIKE